ncbi:MAG TPA: potassium channel family protein [Candidatus Omnitrophota bacterium]|nr:potassium channel family protein [Candidatus Omnitrophota bacterium]
MIRQFVANRFTFLLVSIVSLILASSFAGVRESSLLSLILLVIFLAVLVTLKLNWPFFTLLTVLWAAAFAADLYLVDRVFTRQLQVFSPLGVLTLSFYAFFLFVAIKVLILQIAKEKTVSFDTVIGGVSVYFLLGVLWTFFYLLVLAYDPSAILIMENQELASNMLYFSFSTLTTLGFGDILPKSGLAKSLAILETVTGQLYLAIYVARLVGLHFSELPKGTEKRGSF